MTESATKVRGKEEGSSLRSDPEGSWDWLTTSIDNWSLVAAQANLTESREAVQCSHGEVITRRCLKCEADRNIRSQVIAIDPPRCAEFQQKPIERSLWSLHRDGFDMREEYEAAGKGDYDEYIDKAYDDGCTDHESFIAEKDLSGFFGVVKAPDGRSYVSSQYGFKERLEKLGADAQEEPLPPGPCVAWPAKCPHGEDWESECRKCYFDKQVIRTNAMIAATNALYYRNLPSYTRGEKLLELGKAQDTTSLEARQRLAREERRYAPMFDLEETGDLAQTSSEFSEIDRRAWNLYSGKNTHFSIDVDKVDREHYKFDDGEQSDVEKSMLAAFVESAAATDAEVSADASDTEDSADDSRCSVM